MTNTQPLVRQLLTALKARGARAVFGIPGDYALPMFRQLEGNGLVPLFTLSHEPALGFAADAAARLSGGLGVAAVTYGAGALNLVNSVAGAYAERSPLVVMSAAPALSERGGLFGLHHQSRSLDSQLKIFSEVTCAQAVIDNPETAPREIARALGACTTQSLPVYLEIPMDMCAQPTAPVPVFETRPADPDAAAACAAEIAAIVRNARNPVLMIGIEVKRFGLEWEVSRLADLVNIPVVSSFLGRGVASAGPARIAGTYLGVAGSPELSAMVESSDALILLGVVLSDTDFGVPANRLDLRKAIHAAGGQVRIGHHIYPELPLADLVAALARHAPAKGEGLAGAPAIQAAAPRLFVANDGVMHPSDVSAGITAFFARHGTMPVATDVGDSLFISLETDCGDLVAQSYYASMGFGVPAALGMQAVSGKRPLVLVGDGAFQMTGWELGNCQRYGWDPIVVVLNNQGWEMLRTFEPWARFNDLSDWRFADIAAPLGGIGHRVNNRREFAGALETAHAQPGRFHLIEVMLPRGTTSLTLARFVDAFRKRRATVIAA
ncbi:MAG: indolepyruvate/phenylpyruvate decarboxylase [Alphaproteobacteria bacterium]|nr:indolepyruvate/phenylpyruvate decarboxylase [Alphaproteobacteria bacterium]